MDVRSLRPTGGALAKQLSSARENQSRAHLGDWMPGDLTLKPLLGRNLLEAPSGRRSSTRRSSFYGGDDVRDDEGEEPASIHAPIWSAAGASPLFVRNASSRGGSSPPPRFRRASVAERAAAAARPEGGVLGMTGMYVAPDSQGGDTLRAELESRLEVRRREPRTTPKPASQRRESTL